MSVQSEIANRRLKRIGPVGTIVSLMTASLVAMVGLATGKEPDVILWRALIASCLIGGFVAFGINVIQAANVKRET